MEDPFPLVSGRGFAVLRAHGIEVDVGVEHDAAVRLNQPFLTAVRKGRPFVILKAATSLDGRIAVEGERTSLSSLGALRHAHYMRATVDAIAVGSETILVDDPLLTAREVYRERPLARVVFDRRLRTPASARVLSTLASGPVIILTAPDAEQRGRPRRAEPCGNAGATVMPVNGDAYRGGPPSAAGARHPEPGARGRGQTARGRLGRRASWTTSNSTWRRCGLATGACRCSPGARFRRRRCIERRVEQLGPDVLIEGYVHRPH